MRKLAIALVGLALFVLPIWLTHVAGADSYPCSDGSSGAILARAGLCGGSDVDAPIQTEVPRPNQAPAQTTPPQELVPPSPQATSQVPRPAPVINAPVPGTYRNPASAPDWAFWILGGSVITVAAGLLRRLIVGRTESGSKGQPRETAAAVKEAKPQQTAAISSVISWFPS